MLIAIDGPAASGKGTVAKRIAAHFGLEYLDTGRLYRLVGWELLRKRPGAEPLDTRLATEIAGNLDLSKISSEELETEEVGMAASQVSAIPGVRAALLAFQQNIAKNPKGAVLDGRDIGTVVCPQAKFKFFITAEAEIRAKRRFLQLSLRKPDIKEADILRDILSRDARDKGRKIAPLIPAQDAIYIDTTNIGIEEVFDRVKRVIERE